MRHRADHEIAAVLLDEGRVDVEHLDREPLLVKVQQVFLEGGSLVDGGVTRGLAVLERELLGHVGDSFEGLAQTGAFHTAGTDFERIELVILVENEIDLHRQFAEHEHGNNNAFTLATLAVGLVTELHHFFDNGFAGGPERNSGKVVITLSNRFQRQKQRQERYYKSDSFHRNLLNPM